MVLLYRDDTPFRVAYAATALARGEVSTKQWRPPLLPKSPFAHSAELSWCNSSYLSGSLKCSMRSACRPVGLTPMAFEWL